MPAATSYTEGSLVEFMLTELGSTGTDLGFTDNDDPLLQGVYAVQRLLGLSAITAATDLSLTEAAARWQAWLAAQAAAASQYDLKAGSADLKRSQMFAAIQERLRLAYGFYLVEKARVAAATGTGVFAFGIAAGRRGW